MTQPAATMRILGIDPGLRTTGFGIIDKAGNKLAYVASGTLQTDAALSLPQRLKTIFEGVGEIIRTYQPTCAACEIVFVNVNPQSTLLLGQARGAAVCGLVANNLEVAEFTALQVKQAVVGHGKAAKEQVQHMVQRLLQLPGLPGTDAADALGVAICYANSVDGLAQMGGQMANTAGSRLQQGYKMRRGRLVSVR